MVLQEKISYGLAKELSDQTIGFDKFEIKWRHVKFFGK